LLKNVSSYAGDHEHRKGAITQEALLKDLSFCVQKGSLNVVIGKIGSGKSVLLLTLLEEFKKTG
jgi:ABC-type multidrug transport system ATPase subunit